MLIFIVWLTESPMNCCVMLCYAMCVYACMCVQRLKYLSRCLYLFLCYMFVCLCVRQLSVVVVDHHHHDGNVYMRQRNRKKDEIKKTQTSSKKKNHLKDAIYCTSPKLTLYSIQLRQFVFESRRFENRK